MLNAPAFPSNTYKREREAYYIPTKKLSFPFLIFFSLLAEPTQCHVLTRPCPIIVNLPYHSLLIKLSIMRKNNRLAPTADIQIHIYPTAMACYLIHTNSNGMRITDWI